MGKLKGLGLVDIMMLVRSFGYFFSILFHYFSNGCSVAYIGKQWPVIMIMYVIPGTKTEDGICPSILF